jgi:hypothetical protein
MRSGLSQRAVLVLVVAGLAAVAARVAAPARERNANGLAVCGVERWTVKTLQDKPKLLRRQNTTVAHLISVAKPAHLPNTRLPFERHVFRVTAAVTLVRQEADQDLHIVIQRGPAHMIVEAPNAPTCTPKAAAYRQMIAARKGVLSSGVGCDAAMQPLPRLEVRVRSPTFPGQLVSGKFVLSGTRPDGCPRPGFPPNVVKSRGLPLSFVLCRLVFFHQRQLVRIGFVLLGGIAELSVELVHLGDRAWIALDSLRNPGAALFCDLKN